MTGAGGVAASAAVASVHGSHYAGGTHAAVNGQAPLDEFLSHHVSGAHFLKAQLGVGMNVATHSGDGGRLCKDGVE